MFYSQTLLQKRGGKFGLVWAAATMDRFHVLHKREYYSVDVKKTCLDIIKVVCETDPRKYHFSLLLSSNLMFGTVKVFQYQQQFLLSEVLSLMKNMKGVFETFDVQQYRELPRKYHTDLQDLIGVQETCDPFFGLMKTPEMLVPSQLPDFEPLIMPPPRIDASIDPTESRRGRHLSVPFQPDEGLPLQSPRHEITLKDTPTQSQQIIEVPGELDLPPMETAMLHELMAPTGQPLFTDSENPLPAPPRRITTDTVLESSVAALQAIAEQTPAKFPDLSLPPTPRKRRTAPTTQDVTLQDELGDLFQVGTSSDPMQLGLFEQMRETTWEASMGDTLNHQQEIGEPQVPGAHPMDIHFSPVRPTRIYRHEESMEMRLEPVTPSPLRKRKRRGAPFADREIQIPRQQFQAGLASGAQTTDPAQYMPPAIHDFDMRDTLMTVPSRKTLRSGPLLDTWKRNMITRSVAYEPDPRHPSATVPELRLVGVSSSDTDSEHTREQRRMLEEQIQEPLDAELARAAGDESSIPAGTTLPGEESRSVLVSGRLSRDTVSGSRTGKRRTASTVLEESLARFADLSVEKGRLEQSSRDADRFGDITPHVSILARSRTGTEKDSTLDFTLLEEDSLLHSRLSQHPIAELAAESMTESIPGPPLAPGELDLPGPLQALMEDIQEMPELRHEELEPFREPPETSGQRPRLPRRKELKERLNSPFHLNLCRILEERTAKRQEITFSKLCPPSSCSRKLAARTFSALLDICTYRKVRALQNQPYGEIQIKCGYFGF